MKLQAVINVEFHADDYVAAAEFQQKMQDLLFTVQSVYQTAALDLKQSRERRPKPEPGAAGVRTLQRVSRRQLYEDL